MGEQNQPSKKDSEQEKQRLSTLLQRGINDARLKNKESAQKALREVVKLDPQSEKGWFWLASVAETDDERLEALQNVVLINPDNQRAFQILEKLEKVRKHKTQQAPTPPTQPEVSTDGDKVFETAGELSDLTEDGSSVSQGFTIGNLDPQKSRLVLMGGAATLIALCFILFLAISSGGGSDNGASGGNGDHNTVAAVTTATTVPPTDVPAPTKDPLVPTATLFLSATPPPTATLEPTITPTPEPITYPAPPNEVTGHMLFNSGPYSSGYQPVVLYDLFEDTSETISGVEHGRYPSFNGDMSRYIYIEYSQSTRRADAKIVNTYNSDDEQFFDENWNRDLGVFGVDMTAWSPTDTMIAFVADALNGGNGKNLFVFDFNAAPDAITPFVEIETPETYLEPAWSPDGARIVAVVDAQGSVDLRVYEVGTGTISNLTTDGNAIVESSPDWSADGRIVFSGQSQNSEGSDIYIMPSDGSAAPTVFIDFGPNDVTPRWSPDNNYVAFASDFNGALNVYVYDIANDTFYAVTDDLRIDTILSDWVR